MTDADDLQKLVENLQFVKSAVVKSNNIFRFINISQAMALVGLWGGVGLALLAGFSHCLITRFGTFDAVPLIFRLAFYLSIALFWAAVGRYKMLLILKHARKTYQDITVLRLISDVYTPQSISLLLPFALAGGGVLAFLISRDLGLFIVPAISILLGLSFIAFVNVFYLQEMLVTGNWLLVTGLITLFYAERLSPSLAVIITFGCGFCLLYVAYRLMGKDK
ncbi:MAG: hypothetical protein KGZ32_03110 [Dethiobacter sp.]|jgi:hypothetical protein|nr:hypothetical protein [Dethiobacter sp.]